MPGLIKYKRRKMAPKKAKRYARRRYGISRMPRSLFRYQPTFTETFQPSDPNINLASLFTNQGYHMYVNMNMLPTGQLQSYQSLYNQFAIRKLDIILIPRYGGTDLAQSVTTVPQYYDTRYAYSITDTPDVEPPTSITDVLQDNGCKVGNLTRKSRIKITCKPRPSMQVNYTNTVGAQAGYASMRTSKLQWFNFNNADTNPAYTGENVNHGGVSIWLGNITISASFPVCDVFYKLTFSCRDPK